MAYLRTKRVKGIAYLYLVEGRRIGGKVVQTVIKYLGPARGAQDQHIHYLTPEDICESHQRTLAKHGGSGGVINPGYLDFIADSTMVRHESAPTRRDRIVRKAAHLLFGIVSNHPFIDGNKRTGYEAARTFLMMNGYTIVATTEEIVALGRSISSGRLPGEAEAAEWLRNRLKTAKF